MSLLPCPFCGGDPVADATGVADYNGHEHQDCWVKCYQCGAKVEIETSFCGDFPCSCCHDIWSEMVRRWNTRAPAALQVEAQQPEMTDERR